MQNGATLKVKPQETSILKSLGLDVHEEAEIELDFYMPDGKGSSLSESHFN